MHARTHCRSSASPAGVRAARLLLLISALMAMWLPHRGVAARPAPLVSPVEGMALSDVLEGHVVACGGREAHERVRTRVLLGHVVTELPTWEPPVHEVDTVSIFSDGPCSYVLVETFSEGVRLETWNGEEGRVVRPDGTVVPFAPSDPREAWLTDPNFSVRLQEHFPDMVYLGTAVIEGRTFHVVDTDGDHLHRLYFDAESGLLARLGYNRRVLAYARAGEVLVPSLVEYSRKGGSSTFVVDSVVHNVRLDGRPSGVPNARGAY